MRQSLLRILTWVPVIVISAVIGGAAMVGIDSLREDKHSTAAVIQQAVQPSTSDVSASSGPQDVADLYDKVRPSVVRITGQSARAAGLGSGIVLDKQGDVLTNFHVVDGMDQLDVTFSDGTTSRATVVGKDPGNDVAVIKVSVPQSVLNPAVLGDSDHVRIGELVIAVGNPFSLDGSLTQGIVSGIGRTLAEGGGRPLRQLIQSDAAINPGNSGGALFNARGEIIGITTAIENPSGSRTFAGIGYAVPINSAKRFLPDLLAGKTVLHPKMGVGLTNVTPSLAQRLNINVDQGVLITAIENNSAAAKAGLKGGSGGAGARATGPVGDVIVSIDGKQMKTYDDLANYIDSKNVGDKVSVKFVRDGKEQTVDLTLDPWTG